MASSSSSPSSLPLSGVVERTERLRSCMEDGKEQFDEIFDGEYRLDEYQSKSTTNVETWLSSDNPTAFSDLEDFLDCEAINDGDNELIWRGLWLTEQVFCSLYGLIEMNLRPFEFQASISGIKLYAVQRQDCQTLIDSLLDAALQESFPTLQGRIDVCWRLRDAIGTEELDVGTGYLTAERVEEYQLVLNDKHNEKKGQGHNPSHCEDDNNTLFSWNNLYDFLKEGLGGGNCIKVLWLIDDCTLISFSEQHDMWEPFKFYAQLQREIFVYSSQPYHKNFSQDVVHLVQRYVQQQLQLQQSALIVDGPQATTNNFESNDKASIISEGLMLSLSGEFLSKDEDDETPWLPESWTCIWKSPLQVSNPSCPSTFLGLSTVKLNESQCQGLLSKGLSNLAVSNLSLMDCDLADCGASLVSTVFAPTSTITELSMQGGGSLINGTSFERMCTLLLTNTTLRNLTLRLYGDIDTTTSPYNWMHFFSKCLGQCTSIERFTLGPAVIAKPCWKAFCDHVVRQSTSLISLQIRSAFNGLSLEERGARLGQLLEAVKGAPKDSKLQEIAVNATEGYEKVGQQLEELLRRRSRGTKRKVQE